MLGLIGSGKSTLLEVLVGQPFNTVGSGATKRPVFFQWINNRLVKVREQDLIDIRLLFSRFLFLPQGTRVTIKRDPSLPEFDRDVDVPLAGLEVELGRRLGVDSESPVFVTLESPDTLNFTVIDTPGNYVLDF